MNDDARVLPWVDIGSDAIRELLSPLLDTGSIGTIERAEGGLTNTVYRVVPEGGGAPLALRVFAGGVLPWQRELTMLAQLRGTLPVPEVLMAGRFPYPYAACRWIEGMTLNECRRQHGPAALLSLAAPLGRLLAGVARCSFPHEISDGVHEDSAFTSAKPATLDALLSVSQMRLARGRARARLGDGLADALWHRLATNAGVLSPVGVAPGLVHGDMGGRNILVSPASDGEWRVTGLIDWESAYPGWSLWDVGSLFRYAHRYSQTFRDRFEQAYRAAGGNLPDDWWRTSRLLDATRLVATLDAEPELPVVFRECRELIAAVVADYP